MVKFEELLCEEDVVSVSDVEPEVKIKFVRSAIFWLMKIRI